MRYLSSAEVALQLPQRTAYQTELTWLLTLVATLVDLSEAFSLLFIIYHTFLVSFQ